MSEEDLYSALVIAESRLEAESCRAHAAELECVRLRAELDELQKAYWTLSALVGQDDFL